MKNLLNLLAAGLIICAIVACNGKKNNNKDNSNTVESTDSSSCVNPEFKNVNHGDKFIGVQLWSVRDDMQKDPKTTIEALGKMGYKFVEMAGYSDGKFYGMLPEDFKKLCEDNGIKALGSHYGPNISNEEGSLDKALEEWKVAIDAHKRAGCTYIVKPSQGKWAYESLEGLKAYCDYYNKVGDMCNAAGLRFGYHNHDAEFKEVEGKVIYDYMLENTDPTKVAFELDLYWIDKGGKVATDYFKKYPGRFEYYHVKNEKELCADGEAIFKGAFEDATGAGVKEIVVEVEHYNFEPLVSVMKSLDFLSSKDYVK
ncbi:MAG: sugar phosphate isomerase/epimerase family protein [Bacteroidales bacterium]